LETDKTVLVVEDEVILRMHFCKALNRNNIETVCASNGKKGLSLLKQHKIDLILSDINMPDMDGYVFLAQIKENPETAMIPFFFVTARATSEDKVYGLKLGVRDYITKPVNMEELILRVKNVFETTSIIPHKHSGSSSLSGKIKQGILLDIVQFICQSHQEGCLKVQWSADSGEIWTRDGEVKSAFTSDGKQGEAAIRMMFQVNEGNFFFLDNHDNHPEPNIDLDIMQLLLKGSVILDSQFKEGLKIANIRHKAICRKISEFHMDTSTGTFDIKKLKFIQDAILEIKIQDVRNLKNLNKLLSQLDDLETALGELFSQAGDNAPGLYSPAEKRYIEVAIITQFLHKLEITASDKKEVEHRLDALVSHGYSSQNNESTQYFFSSFAGINRSSDQRKINFPLFRKITNQLTGNRKSKESCRPVLLSQLKKYFHHLSLIPDSTRDIRLGFVGLYTHLITFFKTFSDVPPRITEIKDRPEDPVLLMTRLENEDGNYLYLMGLPLVTEKQAIAPFLASTDFGILIHSNLDSEKNFNQEMLLKILVEMHDNRILLHKIRESEKDTGAIFDLFTSWENHHTISSASRVRQSLPKILKFCSGLE